MVPSRFGTFGTLVMHFFILSLSLRRFMFGLLLLSNFYVFFLKLALQLINISADVSIYNKLAIFPMHAILYLL